MYVKHYFGTMGDLMFGAMPDYPYTVELAIALAGNVAAGLVKLHASEVSHNDISGSTIFLDQVGDELRAKIGGFSFASQFSDGQVVASKPNVNGAHLNYAAPESLQRFVTSSWKASAAAMKSGDVYSLSVLMYESLCRQPAWEGQSKDDILATVQGGNRPAFGELPDVEEVQLIKRVVQSCWTQDFAQRPAAQLVVSMLKGN